MSDAVADKSAAPDDGIEEKIGDGIEVQVNGQSRRLPKATSVRGLLERLRLEPQLCAVERNGQVVPRRDHDREIILPGDSLEVVTFVGGG